MPALLVQALNIEPRHAGLSSLHRRDLRTSPVDFPEPAVKDATGGKGKSVFSAKHQSQDGGDDRVTDDDPYCRLPDVFDDHIGVLRACRNLPIGDKDAAKHAGD